MKHHICQLFGGQKRRNAVFNTSLATSLKSTWKAGEEEERDQLLF